MDNHHHPPPLNHPHHQALHKHPNHHKHDDNNNINNNNNNNNNNKNIFTTLGGIGDGTVHKYDLPSPDEDGAAGIRRQDRLNNMHKAKQQQQQQQHNKNKYDVRATPTNPLVKSESEVGDEKDSYVKEAGDDNDGNKQQQKQQQKQKKHVKKEEDVIMIGGEGYHHHPSSNNHKNNLHQTIGSRTVLPSGSYGLYQLFLLITMAIIGIILAIVFNWNKTLSEFYNTTKKRRLRRRKLQHKNSGTITGIFSSSRVGGKRGTAAGGAGGSGCDRRVRTEPKKSVLSVVSPTGTTAYKKTDSISNGGGDDERGEQYDDKEAGVVVGGGMDRAYYSRPRHQGTTGGGGKGNIYYQQREPPPRLRKHVVGGSTTVPNAVVKNTMSTTRKNHTLSTTTKNSKTKTQIPAKTTTTPTSQKQQIQPSGCIGFGLDGFAVEETIDNDGPGTGGNNDSFIEDIEQTAISPLSPEPVLRGTNCSNNNSCTTEQRHSAFPFSEITNIPTQRQKLYQQQNHRQQGNQSPSSQTFSSDSSISGIMMGDVESSPLLGPGGGGNQQQQQQQHLDEDILFLTPHKSNTTHDTFCRMAESSYSNYALPTTTANNSTANTVAAANRWPQPNIPTLHCTLSDDDSVEELDLVRMESGLSDSNNDDNNDDDNTPTTTPRNCYVAANTTNIRSRLNKEDNTNIKSETTESKSYSDHSIDDTSDLTSNYSISTTNSNSRPPTPTIRATTTTTQHEDETTIQSPLPPPPPMPHQHKQNHTAHPPPILTPSVPSNGETEGGNGVMHKRKDLTAWTDAASSLTSPIPYSELTLGNLIGGGGFGQVWEAKWRGTPVAVKVLTVTSALEHVQKAILQEFAAEINMVSGMRHPNVCLYIGACLEAPNRAIVTELAANGSLWDALRKTLQPPYLVADGTTRFAWPTHLYPSSGTADPFNDGTILADHRGVVPSDLPPPYAPIGAWPWVLVKRVASGAARGMNYLHCGQPSVLHRDLKSANILLDESYNAKVCDFGLSRLTAKTRSMTGNCGTVQWMAPEILANESYAEPCDVYSYGIILWELLVRQCPYGDMSAIQCALAVLNNNSRPEIPHWCPPAFGALIASCLEKNPMSRPTFSQILSALDSIP